MVDDRLATIIVGSHFFKVREINYKLNGLLMEFCKLYTKYEIEQGGPQKGQLVPKKTYASIMKDFSEYRFHFNQLGHFLEFMAQKGISKEMFRILKKPLKEAAEISSTMRPGWKLREHQQKAVDFVVSDEGGNSKLIAAPVGSGKRVHQDTPILTSSGWKKIKDLNVGEWVASVDGAFAQVDGVFPQGVSELYNVEFRDGRVIKAGPDHLWKVHHYAWSKEWKVITTEEIRKILENPKARGRLRIPLYEPEDGDDIDLPIDPYLLGCLIGDGGLSQRGVKFTKSDDFFMDELTPLLPEGVKLVKNTEKEWSFVRTNEASKNPLRILLDELGYKGSLSYTKFIPPIYLMASKRQRLALLQGLMDTDGDASFSKGRNGKGHGATMSFTTTSERLSKDFQQLVWSLGGMAYTASRVTKYIHNGEKKEGRMSWRTHIRLKQPSSAFRLPRKKARVKDENQYSKNLALGIKSVTKCAPDEAVCISVDHPSHLYVAENYIVTHNTVMSNFAVMARKKRVAVCVLPKYMDKWQYDIAAGTTCEKFLSISGGKALKSVIQMAQEDINSLPDVLIFSLTTLQLWYKAYEEMDPEAEGYGINPDQLWETLGVGSVLVDETHEHINSVWNLMLYSNVDLFLGLTGTLISEDRFITMIHKIMFPKEIRYDEIKMDKYIDLYPVAYDIKDFKDQKIRTTALGSNNYSHTEFEKSLMKNKKLLESYLNMIESFVRSGYEERAKPGDKCILYFATIAMCTLVTQRFKERFPNRDVRRYVEKDPYENIIDAEIKISTPISAGTALDMPGLIAVFATNSIYSPVQNIQMLGRLRNLKDREMKYYYFYCKQIRKQVDYHNKRLELYEERTKSIRKLNYHSPLLGLPAKDSPEYHMGKNGIPGNRYTPTRGVNQWRPSNNPWRAPPKRGFDSLSPGTHNRVRYGY